MKSLHLSTAADGRKPIAIWLLICCAMVFGTLVVGGVTRLTDSGLSIVEWQPLLGAIPPLTHDDWLLAFEKYKQIPQFHQVNHDMTLEGFQYIFWWEWAHRQIGRVIGMALNQVVLPGFAAYHLGEETSEQQAVREAAQGGTASPVEEDADPAREREPDPEAMPPDSEDDEFEED